jgi:ribose/xylose/arabinose/galactoside ABC-type transport system permease subunit
VGSVANSILGVLSIKIIENCINLLGVSYHLYLAVQGAIILLAIILGNLTNRRV